MDTIIFAFINRLHIFTITVCFGKLFLWLDSYFFVQLVLIIIIMIMIAIMIIIPTAMEYNYYNVLNTNFILKVPIKIVKKQMRPSGVKVFDNKNSLELASFDKDVMPARRAYIYIYRYIFIIQAV